MSSGATVSGLRYSYEPSDSKLCGTLQVHLDSNIVQDNANNRLVIDDISFCDMTWKLDVIYSQSEDSIQCSMSPTSHSAIDRQGTSSALLVNRESPERSLYFDTTLPLKRDEAIRSSIHPIKGPNSRLHEFVDDDSMFKLVISLRYKSPEIETWTVWGSDDRRLIMWRIKDLSLACPTGLIPNDVTINGSRWRISCHPRGIQMDDFMEFRLHPRDAARIELPKNSKAVITVLNHKHPEKSQIKSNKLSEGVVTFDQIWRSDVFCNPDLGFLQDGWLTISIYLSALEREPIPTGQIPAALYSMPAVDRENLRPGSTIKIGTECKTAACMFSRNSRLSSVQKVNLESDHLVLIQRIDLLKLRVRKMNDLCGENTQCLIFFVSGELDTGANDPPIVRSEPQEEQQAPVEDADASADQGNSSENNGADWTAIYSRRQSLDVPGIYCGPRITRVQRRLGKLRSLSSVSLNNEATDNDFQSKLEVASKLETSPSCDPEEGENRKYLEDLFNSYDIGLNSDLMHQLVQKIIDRPSLLKQDSVLCPSVVSPVSEDAPVVKEVDPETENGRKDGHSHTEAETVDLEPTEEIQDRSICTKTIETHLNMSVDETSALVSENGDRKILKRSQSYWVASESRIDYSSMDKQFRHFLARLEKKLDENIEKIERVIEISQASLADQCSANALINIVMEEFVDPVVDIRRFQEFQGKELPCVFDETLKTNVYFCNINKDFRFRISIKQRSGNQAAAAITAARIVTPDQSAVNLKIANAGVKQGVSEALVLFDKDLQTSPLLKKVQPAYGYVENKYLKMTLELTMTVRRGDLCYKVTGDIYCRMVPENNSLLAARAYQEAKVVWEKSPEWIRMYARGITILVQLGVRSVAGSALPATACTGVFGAMCCLRSTVPDEQ